MSVQSGESLPGFFSTHPDPGDREVRVGELADEWQKKVAYQPRGVTRYDYLKRIDGMVYGDDPRQGYVDGQMFYHPTLRFQFPIPKGWQLANSASTIMMIDPEKKAAVKLTLGKGDSPGAAADDFVSKSKATVRRREERTIQDFNAVVLESAIQADDGELWIMSYFIHKDDNIYVFHGFTSAGLYVNYALAFGQAMGGFDEVTDDAVLNKKPKRVQVKKATQSGTLSSVLKAMRKNENMHSEIALLNGLDTDARVKEGDWLKLVGE